MQQSLSEYMQGAYGWLIPLAMLGLTLGSLALVTILARLVRVPRTRPRLTLMAIWAQA